MLRAGLNLSLVAWWIVRGTPTWQSSRDRQEVKRSLRLIQGTRDDAMRQSPLTANSRNIARSVPRQA
ncbi:MAG: hypothetical protein JWO59_2814 [Chloroflexi bacterium]|jgi:hypothetical protein|nr:hypothetical protein [Chloroflexota bacterium]